VGILYACRFTAASVVGGRRRPSGSMQSASTKPTAPRARERSDSFSTSEPRSSTPSRLPRICGPSAIEPVSTLPEQALASAPADADANSGSGLHDPRPREAPDNAADRRGRLKSHRLMLIKDLRIAHALTPAPARRAPRSAPSPTTRSAPGLSTAELTSPWPGGTALRPIPAGARPYAGVLHARVRVAATRAPCRYGTPRPTVPSVGWCLQRPRTLGRPSRSRRVPPGATAGGVGSAPHPSASSRAEQQR
jgi:hypothetical protein